MRVSARTRVFAVLGDPVAHSLSPMMHNAGFQAAGLDAVYVALPATAERLGTVMETLASAGGGGNVTIPFKQLATATSATSTERVQRLGSANVFAAGVDGLHLANSDVDGILAATKQLDTAGDAWLVIGTGGSARAVAGAALERGARLAVQSRRPERATEFANWARGIGVTMATRDECGLAINTTPLGLRNDDALPLDLATLGKSVALLDLVYAARGTTRWVSAARAVGRRAIDGREVLLAQGVASWPIWFPGIAAPVDVMRAALNGSLG